MKPFAEACEQNKHPILAVLRRHLPEKGVLLEIGAGTGQHAVFFAARFPGLQWHASDVAEQLPGLAAWIEEAGLPNLHGPLALDVTHEPWPLAAADAVFSANTAHIMAWPQVEAMFAGIGRILNPGGVFCLYGPFNYGGRYTAPSNERFDAWLRQRDPASGVRDFEALDALARSAGLALAADHPMPADNRTLVWRRPA